MPALDFAALRPTPPPPSCEYTAAGSETEAVDCWNEATYRYIDGDGMTKLLLCDDHRGQRVPFSLTGEKMSVAR